MKKPILYFSAVAIMAACNNNQESTTIKQQTPAEFEKELIQVFGVDTSYKITTTIEGVQNVSYADITRFSMNITTSATVTPENLEKELRKHLYDFYNAQPTAHAIMIKCFKPNENTAFKTAILSADGTWQGADKYQPISSYKVIIK